MIDKLREDLKTAMKAGDRTAVATLRMVLSEIHNREIERGEELDEDDVLAVLDKAVKTRREAAEAYDEGGREERAAAERREIEILRRYLPDQLDDDELEAAINEVVEATGAGGMQDMGAVMGELMERYRGRIDGKAASERVRARLQGS